MGIFLRDSFDDDTSCVRKLPTRFVLCIEQWSCPLHRARCDHCDVPVVIFCFVCASLSCVWLEVLPFGWWRSKTSRFVFCLLFVVVIPSHFFQPCTRHLSYSALSSNLTCSSICSSFSPRPCFSSNARRSSGSSPSSLFLFPSLMLFLVGSRCGVLFLQVMKEVTPDRSRMKKPSSCRSGLHGLS